MMTRMKKLLVLLAAAVLFFHLQTDIKNNQDVQLHKSYQAPTFLSDNIQLHQFYQPIAEQPTAEVTPTYGVFVDAFHTPLTNAYVVDSLVDFVESNNMDIIIVQVRRRGELFYGKRDFDALDYLISKVYGKNIIIVASLDIGWKNQTPFDFSKESDRKAALEIVRPLLNYDIYGINLDYIRYIETKNVTDIQRNSVTELVRQIYGITSASGKKLFATVVTWYPSPYNLNGVFEKTRPYKEVGQSWKQWIEEGIIDVVLPMNYFRYPDFYETYLEWLDFEASLKGYNVKIGAVIPDYMGVPTKLYIDEARNRGLEPIIIFSYNTMVN